MSKEVTNKLTFVNAHISKFPHIDDPLLRTSIMLDEWEKMSVKSSLVLKLITIITSCG